MGGGPGADLVAAFDESIQEGWFDPRTVVPVARALGVSHIVVANDLEIERYRIQRPQVVMDHLLDPAAGLDLVATFGPDYVNQNPGQPIVDETELRARSPRRPRRSPRSRSSRCRAFRPRPLPRTCPVTRRSSTATAPGSSPPRARGCSTRVTEPVLSGFEIATWTWPGARLAVPTPATSSPTRTARRSAGSRP